MPVYLITYLLLFWLPVFILGFACWSRLDAPARKAFWVAMAIMLVVTTVMEYVYLGLHLWNFSEAIDPLLGIRIFGVPIEEFVFWWGATPLFAFLYLFFVQRLFPRKRAVNG
jgi:lycopene cyclase domain-containing protein